MVELNHYRFARDYPSPHGIHLQEFHKTGNRLIEIAGTNGFREVWVVTQNGGAILFDLSDDANVNH